MSDISALRKIKPRKRESDRGPTLNRVVKEVLLEDVTFEQN